MLSGSASSSFSLGFHRYHSGQEGHKCLVTTPNMASTDIIKKGVALLLRDDEKPDSPLGIL